MAARSGNEAAGGADPGSARSLRVGVFGAGAIGGYLGVRLSAAGVPVVLVGRRSLADARLELEAVDLAGAIVRPAGDLVADEDPARLRHCDVCLLTVKSGDTAAAAATLAGVLRPDALVLSFQNGLRNLAALRESSLACPLAAGMVTFNVRREGAARFKKTTDGPLLAGPVRGDASRLEPLSAAFARAGEPLGLRADIEAVQAGKLLLNLNNGLCAATGLSIAESLGSPILRRCFALCLREGLDVLRAAGVPAVRVGRLAPGLVARVLVLPDPVVRVLARGMMQIDPAARSSTLQDLDRGRPTEIDWLNGEIVAVARRLGRDAPANRFVVETVHRLEAAGRPVPFVTPAHVLAGMRAAGAG